MQGQKLRVVSDLFHTTQIWIYDISKLQIQPLLIKSHLVIDREYKIFLESSLRAVAMLHLLHKNIPLQDISGEHHVTSLDNKRTFPNNGDVHSIQRSSHSAKLVRPLIKTLLSHIGISPTFPSFLPASVSPRCPRYKNALRSFLSPSSSFQHPPSSRLLASSAIPLQYLQSPHHASQ